MDAGSPADRDGRARGYAGLRFLWILCPLLYPVLHLGAGVLPTAIRATLGFLLVVLLPGWMLHLVVLPGARIGLAARITRSFAFGLALVSALGLAAWFLGGDAALGPVRAPAGEAPPFLGRLDAVLWGEAALVLLMALALAVRSGRALIARAAPRPAALGAQAGRASRSAGPGPAGIEAGGQMSGSPGAGEAGGVHEPVEHAWGRRPTLLMQRVIREAYRLGDQHKVGHPVAPRWATLLVLGVIVVAAAGLGFYAGGDYGVGRDSLAHTATIRAMSVENRILPRTAFYADGDGAAVDSRMGFFHVAMAAVCRLAGVSAVDLWLLLPGILAPFALIIFHSLARRLLGSEGTALFATFLAMILMCESARGLLTRLGYGNQMGMVLAWSALSIALHYAIEDRRRALLWAVGLSAFAAAAVHIFAILQALFCLGVFAAALLLVRGPRHATGGRVLATLGAAAMGALPIVLWRLAFTHRPLNPLHTHTHGLCYLSSGLYAFLPSAWWPELGWLGAGGIVLSFFLWKAAREDDRALYLAALSVAPLLIVANPLIVPLLEPVLGYLVARFVVTVPFVLVLAHMARRMGENLLRLNSWRRVGAALLFYAFMLALFFPRLGALARSYTPESRGEQRLRSALVWEDLLAEIETRLPEPAVILSDPFTGYSIPALTHHHTVAVLHQHGSPSDSLALERLAACRDVLSPYIGTGEKARLCRRFGVDYVLLNGLISRPLHAFFADTGADIVRRQSQALHAAADLFAPVTGLHNRGAILYRVRKENLDALCGILAPGEARLVPWTTAEAAREILVRRLPTRAVPVLSDTVAGITLAAAVIDTTLLARGERTTVTLYWHRAGVPSRFPVASWLRLDTPAPQGRFWSAGLSKLHRNLFREREGEIYRLEVARPLLDGLFGVEHWPPDGFVVDRVGVRMPEAAVPGDYVVGVKWMEATVLPNLPLRHFFADDDAYVGTPIGALEVY